MDFYLERSCECLFSQGSQNGNTALRFSYPFPIECLDQPINSITKIIREQSLLASYFYVLQFYRWTTMQCMRGMVRTAAAPPPI